MFGIGIQEMIIILVVVLIVFGPKRLPDLAKSLGKGIAEFKKASDEVRKGIEEATQEEEGPGAAPKDSGIADTPEARALETLSAETAETGPYPAGSQPSGESPVEAPRTADAHPADAEPAPSPRRD